MPDTDRTAHRRSNFGLSFLVLPPEQRRAIERVYRFCRAVDDVADGPLDLAAKRAELEAWSDELDRCYRGRPQRPEMLALQQTIGAFALERAPFDDLVRGVRMDLTPARFPNFDALAAYCDCVAGTVGRICVRIFGLGSPRYRDYAITLGRAFQLTNILRDVGGDAAHGRIYLPLDDLARFDCTEEQILARRDDERFRRLMRFEYDRACALYRQAADWILPADRPRLIAAEIMTGVYRALLDALRHAEFRVLDRTIRLGSGRKLWIAVTTWAENRRVRR